MSRPEVVVVGAGIHPFGRHEELTAFDQAAVAIQRALADAGVGWSDVDVAFGGSQDGGNADTLVGRLGLTGVPFVNVYNGCATGASALVSACSALESGRAELALAVGFDKHPRGAFAPRPVDWGLEPWYGETGLMLTTQFFAMKIQRYLHDHDLPREVLAAVAAKAYRNGAATPSAWRRTPLTVEEIEASPMVSDPLTQYMFCSPGEGAVALVLARASDAEPRHRPVVVRGVSFRTRRYGTFEVFNPSLPLARGASPTTDAARAAFEEAGLSPGEVDLVQMQDTESGAEVMHLAECGFCAHGDQGDLILSGGTEIGGSLPVNTDGGCIANGEPVGASGLRQVHENVLQLRGEAGERQVAGARSAFSHVYGAPGVSACTVLTR